ncbi:MAG: beta propeller repeat protein [Acidimicrobiales bacterium]
MSATPHDEVRLVDAYIDARRHAAADTVALDPALVTLVDRLAALPADAWAPAPAEHRPNRRRFGPPPSGRPSVGVATARWSARRAVTASAAVVVVLAGVLAAVAVGGPPRPSPAPSSAWALAGYIDQPGWQAAPSAPASVAPTVACPAPGHCYAATTARAGAPVERTTDGGGSWSATATPPGVWLTSGLSCPAPSSCAVAGEGDVQAGASSPAGGVAEVLVTGDAGATWSTWRLPAGVAEATDLACTDLVHCVVAGFGPSSGTGAVLAVSAVTTDGGLDWVTTDLPGGFVPRKLTGLACPSPTTCALGGFDAAGGASPAALYSTDGGAAWAAAGLPSGVPAGTVWSVSCGASDACTALVPAVVPGAPAVGQPPTAAVSSVDGGRTWQSTAPFSGDPALLTALSCVGPSSCWATGQQLTGGGGAALLGVVESTTDAGRSWTADPVSGVGTGSASVGAVTSVACASDGSCVALALSLRAGGTGQLVLRGPAAP